MWSAHTHYKSAWTKKENISALSKYSSQFLFVAKGTIDVEAARNQLVRISTQNLRDLGEIGSGMGAWHATQVVLFPYVYFFIPADEVYERIFSYGYFGSLSKNGQLYGVENAARSLWKVAPEDISTSQAALLLAVYWSPTRFDPYKHPEAALQGRNSVMEKLAQKGLISKEEVNKVSSAPLGVQ